MSEKRNGESSLESKIVLYTNENYNTYEYVPISSTGSYEYEYMVNYVNELNLKLEEYVKTKHTTVESFPCRGSKILASIDDYKEFNHVYVMYFVAGKVFTVHYEIESSSKEDDDILSLKIHSLETLKYDESNDNFVVVSKVIINPNLKQYRYRFGSYYSYFFDVGFKTDVGYFFTVNSDFNNGCNYYYNSGDWSEYDNSSVYFRFCSTVLAKDN